MVSTNLYKLLSLVTCYVSGSFTLTLLTLDRLFGVALKRVPSFQQFKSRTIYIILFLIWICSFGCASYNSIRTGFHVSICVVVFPAIN